jgi:hypothetical protein
MLQRSITPTNVGSQDGTGCGDHDLPYKFGWRPRAEAPYPFSTRQYARLLVLRSRTEGGVFESDDQAESQAA